MTEKTEKTMKAYKTFLVKPNGSEIEVGEYPEDMPAEDILTLAKASAAKQGDASVALGKIDEEELDDEKGIRKIILKQTKAKTKG